MFLSVCVTGILVLLLGLLSVFCLWFDLFSPLQSPQQLGYLIRHNGAIRINLTQSRSLSTQIIAGFVVDSIVFICFCGWVWLLTALCVSECWCAAVLTLEIPMCVCVIGAALYLFIYIYNLLLSMA